MWKSFFDEITMDNDRECIYIAHKIIVHFLCKYNQMCFTNYSKWLTISTYNY